MPTMTTQQAIDFVTALKTGNTSTIGGLTTQNQVLDVILGQLQGVLNTPSADLAKAQSDLATEVQAHQDDNTASTKEINGLEATVNDAITAAQDTTSDPATVVANVLAALGVPAPTQS